MKVTSARIALGVLAVANAAFVLAGVAIPPRLTTLGTMIVCGGSVLIAHRENPARFHRQVGRREATRLLLIPIVFVGGVILLARVQLL